MPTPATVTAHRAAPEQQTSTNTAPKQQEATLTPRIPPQIASDPSFQKMDPKEYWETLRRVTSTPEGCESPSFQPRTAEDAQFVAHYRLAAARNLHDSVFSHWEATKTFLTAGAGSSLSLFLSGGQTALIALKEVQELKLAFTMTLVNTLSDGASKADAAVELSKLNREKGRAPDYFDLKLQEIAISDNTVTRGLDFEPLKGLNQREADVMSRYGEFLERTAQAAKYLAAIGVISDTVVNVVSRLVPKGDAVREGYNGAQRVITELQKDPP